MCVGPESLVLFSCLAREEDNYRKPKPPLFSSESVMTLLRTFFLATLAIAFYAMPANAIVVHETDYEAEPTTGFGVGPATMGFTDGGGDIQGFGNGDNSGSALGVSSANPNSGSFHYAVDTGSHVMPLQGNGWGGTWSGQDTNGGSGGFLSPAAAMAAGPGSQYIDLVGATFTATVQVATDATDPAVGPTAAEIRLEFNGATADIIPRAVSAPVGAASLTTTYQPITISKTLTAAEVAMGIDRVVAVIGTNGSGDNNGADGLIYFDDYVFEVSDANIRTVPIPEPGAAAMILAGLLSIGCVVRRRKN